MTVKEAFIVGATEVLSPYKVRFEEKLAKAFDGFGSNNGVKEAVVYALSGSGKRFRPALVYMVADALNNHIDVTPAALAVEYFHTSSLIADDLPCMDNDDFRRGRLTTHKVYGESTALLASYALIAAGFEQIAVNGYHMQNFASNSSEIAQIATLEAAKHMGASGLIGGQYFDLFPKGSELEHILEVIDMKTVALFDLSLTLGWLFGGGDKEKLPLVHLVARHFGIAFQILDDLDDMQKDASHGSLANFANRFGVEEAVRAVHRHVDSFDEGMEKLHFSCQPLSSLAHGLRILSRGFAEI